MRKTYLLLALLAALPVAALAWWTPGDGTLSVEDGRGKITLQARGGVIGRIDRGTVTVYDLTPDRRELPRRHGRRPARFFVGGNGIRYRRLGIRFRIVGGGFSW